MTSPNNGIPPQDGAPHPADADRVGTAVATYAPRTAVGQRNETAAAMLGARAKAEVEARFIIARHNPRDEERFRERLLAACERFVFADAAMYEKPVGNNQSATGLSVRFAEEAARLYGNIDVSVAIVHEDDERRVIEATAVDLETNNTYRAQAVVPKYVERKSPRQGDEVVGSRTNSRGQTTYKVRATDDALFTASQAASAKASREATLKLIPAEYKEEAIERIERTIKAVGTKDPEKFIADVVSTFHKLGVSEPQLAEFLGKSPSQMSVAEAHLLRRIHQGIRQGEATWADVMKEKRGGKEAEAAPSKGTGAEALADSLAKQAGKGASA